jgi:hypothetical protein
VIRRTRPSRIDTPAIFSTGRFTIKDCADRLAPKDLPEVVLEQQCDPAQYDCRLARTGDGRMNKSYAPSTDERSGSAATSDGSDGTTKTRVASDFVVPILLGGIIAGTLDIAAASLINGAQTTRILQAIASGLLGKSAFDGGSATVELGLILQWAMSIIIASIFVVAAQWRPVLKHHWVKAGLAFGVVIFLVMNYVILPLSAIGHPPRFRFVHFMEDLVAMLLFGTIVASFTRERPNRKSGSK